MAVNGTVVFLPLSRGNCLEMLPLARALKAEGKWRPLFCLESKQSGLLSLLQTEGIDARRTDGSACAPVSDVPRDPVPATSEPSLKKSAFRFLPPFFQALLTCRAERKRARRFLQKNPDVRLVLVAGDRNVGPETALIAEANSRKIPSMIVPFAMSFPEASAEPRLRRGSFEKKYGVRTLPRTLLRLLFPSWVFVHKGHPMFFHPPYTALAAWVLGMYPRHPWLIGGGSAALMAVESEAMRSLLLEQGMDAAKMTVTGKPSLDAIAKELSSVSVSETRARLGIPENAKVVLCAVPQLAEHDILSWEQHREEMEFLFQTLAATGQHVLLSLHPKSDRAWYQPLADAAGAQIATERIYDLLPACDVLVATYSSTVAPAIALCKPAVVVDFYDLQYPLYASAPGVTVLRDKTQFLPYLLRLLDDAAFYASAVQAQREHGKEWALLDGGNTRRVLEVAETLMAKAA